MERSAPMLVTLFPCPSCARHVRVADASCPFCQAPLAARAPRRIPDLSRLSRAAQVAFGAALAAACASEPGPGPVAPVYGAPAPVDDGGMGAPVEPVPEGTGGQAGSAGGEAYQPEPSPPPPPEQGPPEGAARPLYGVPPPPQ